MKNLLCSKCFNFVETIFIQKGIHIGEYCPLCKTWIRWVPKEEVEERKLTVIEEEDKSIPLF